MNCPFCGAKEIYSGEYECGSEIWEDDVLHQGLICQSRQIYQLQVRAAYLENRLDSEIDQSQQYFEDLQGCINKRLDLEKRLAAWHQHWKEDHGYETQWTAPLRQLKDLGEI